MPDEAMTPTQTPPPIVRPLTRDYGVEVFTDFAAAQSDWAALEECAVASIYQTRRFVVPWFDTMGVQAGMTPLIIVVRETDGAPAALFPMGLRRVGGLGRIEFLGGKDSNANMALIRPGLTLSGEDVLNILRRGAAQAGAPADYYALLNQPERWQGVDNPLAALPSQPSPSYCHSAALTPDSEAFHRQQLSSDGRKKLRAKRRKLEELGPVSLLTARTSEEATRLLDAFFEQKRQRFDEQNIRSGFDSPAARGFFERCCISRIARRDSSVEIHGLMVGSRIAATYGGGVHRSRFHGMINSFDPDPAIARYSPGEILLSLLIESKCRQGLAEFDLGVGEGRYKSTWCDRVEPLFDTLIALTTRGRAMLVKEAVKLRVKRAIKQTPWAFALAKSVRRRLPL